MSDSGFPWLYSEFGGENLSTAFFIGGSTMSGKGITTSTYPELFSIETRQSVICYTKYLVKLSEVISLIESIDISDVRVFINCGAGDQMRVMNPSALKVLPKHWGKPAHMEAPLNYSILTKKRFKQRVVLLIKYFIKYLVRYLGLYQNSTSVKNFREQLQQLALIAHERSLRIFWIDTALGDYRVPSFIRREREMYCRNLIRETFGNFPDGSVYLSYEGSIESTDFLDDAFHLNSNGHQKLCNLLLTSGGNEGIRD